MAALKASRSMALGDQKAAMESGEDHFGGLGRSLLGFRLHTRLAPVQKLAIIK